MLTLMSGRRLRAVSLCAVILSASGALAGDGWFSWTFEGWDKVHPRTSLQDMAHAIDCLEKQIDCYGSVVVKQPDVYGEARWTKHRADYEKILGGELGNFKFTVNAKIREADTAFFMNAAALGATVKAGGAAPAANVTQIFSADAFPQPSFLGLPGAPVVTPQGAAVPDAVAIEPTEFLDQMSRYVQHLNQLRRINEGDDTADAAGYALNLMRIPVSVLPGHKTRTGYGAEVTMTLVPELSDDLLPSTFKDLVINDLVDQLGLPIVKIVDRQSWSQTTIERERRQTFQEELARFHRLKATYENYGRKAAKTDLESLFGSANLEKICHSGIKQEIAGIREKFWTTLRTEGKYKSNLEILTAWDNEDPSPRAQLAAMPSEWEKAQLERTLEQLRADATSTSNPRDLWGRAVRFGVGVQVSQTEKQLEEAKANALKSVKQENAQDSTETIAAAEETLKVISDAVGNVSTQLGSITAHIVNTGLSSPRDRQARYPVPPTEIACVFGEEELFYIAKDLDSVRESSGVNRIHLPSAQGFLAEELDAAYRYLTTLRRESGYDAWMCLCPRIARAVKQLQYDNPSVHGPDVLKNLRDEFRAQCGWDSCEMLALCDPANPRKCRSMTIKSLAWAILVESALLNDHLIDDMQRVEKNKSTPILPNYICSYFGPDPDPTARATFNTYVRARWPIHVFAIDPENQEQNVADSFARRRETQLALALAFTSGKMNANNFSRFARRIDFELDTISLNRTVVGFSHGEDTFGWRVYPRVQVPPVDGSLKTMAQLIKGGPSRDYDMKRRQLEPGSRELLAIVIMPSFVPYVRLDVRSNWFQLTKPDRKEFTTEDSVRMGQMITYIQQCKSQFLTEAPMGRPGDSRRLLQAVNQLEKRLPLQDTLVQIPYENSRGGFQLFAEGTRNLGPELIGYYGEPGINSKDSTTLFLVGRHFNVTGTQVTCGGKSCTAELLSRDVMKVTIPKDTMSVTINDYELGLPKKSLVVDMRVATPYGVSGPLYVPVIDGPGAAAASTLDPSEVDGTLVYDANGVATGVLLAKSVAWKGTKKGSVTNVTINMKAVLGNGVELSLLVNDPTSKKETADFKGPDLAPTTDDPPLDPTVYLNPLITPGNIATTRLLACQNPVALKVSGKMKVGDKETPVGPLLIRLCNNRACSTCLSQATTPIESLINAPLSADALFEYSESDPVDEVVRPVTYELLGKKAQRPRILEFNRP